MHSQQPAGVTAETMGTAKRLRQLGLLREKPAQLQGHLGDLVPAAGLEGQGALTNIQKVLKQIWAPETLLANLLQPLLLGAGQELGSQALSHLPPLAHFTVMVRQ
jgi:hypothetical protein